MADGSYCRYYSDNTFDVLREAPSNQLGVTDYDYASPISPTRPVDSSSLHVSGLPEYATPADQLRTGSSAPSFNGRAPYTQLSSMPPSRVRPMTQFTVDDGPRISTPRQAVQPRLSIHDAAAQPNPQPHHSHQPRLMPLTLPQQPDVVASTLPPPPPPPPMQVSRPLPPIPEANLENAVQVQALLEEQKKLIRAIEGRNIAQGQEAYKLAANMSTDDRQELIRSYEKDAEKRAYNTLMEVVAREEDAVKQPSWERVAETGVVEMDSSDFLIAGTGPKVDRQNYHWKFGREDGQFRCALGHNTQFKVNMDDAFALVSETPHPDRRVVWVDGFKFYVHNSVADEDVVNLLFDDE